MGTILWNCVLSCEWDYGTQSCFQYVIKWLLANVDKLWLSCHHSTRLAKISIFIYLKIPLLHSTLNVLKVWFINLIWSKSKQVPCINISDFNFSSALYCINVFLEWNFFSCMKSNIMNKYFKLPCCFNFSLFEWYDKVLLKVWRCDKQFKTQF